MKISPDAVNPETNIMKAREQLNVSTSDTRIETITAPILQAKKRRAKGNKKAELNQYKSTFSFTYPSQESLFFLSIITERENIRFYPIYEEEVVNLYAYLEKLTGLAPLPEKDIVKAVLVCSTK